MIRIVHLSKKDADFGFDGFKIVTNILSDDHLKLHWDTDFREMDM